MRALLVFITCVGIAGCGSCVDVKGNRFSCDPTTAEANQCPGGWRCGLEHSCHALGDTSVAWKCQTDLECEGDPRWSCGLSSAGDFRECHDPAAADAGFTCSVDTDCVRGWRCGLDARCVDSANTSLETVDVQLSGGIVLNPTIDPNAALIAVSNPFEKGTRQMFGFVVDGGLVLLDRDIAGVTAAGVSPYVRRDFEVEGEPSSLSILGGDTHWNGVAERFSVFAAYADHRFRVLTVLNDAGLIFNDTVLDDGGVFTSPNGWSEVGSATTNFGSPSEAHPSRVRIGSTGDVDYTPVLASPSFDPTSVASNEFFWWSGGASFTTSWIYADGAYVFDPGADPETQFIPMPSDNRVFDQLIVGNHGDDGGLGVTLSGSCAVTADDRGLWVFDVNDRTYLPWNVAPFDSERCAARNNHPQTHRVKQLSSLRQNTIGVAGVRVENGVDVPDSDFVALIDVSAWWAAIVFRQDVADYRGCDTIVDFMTGLAAPCDTFFDPDNGQSIPSTPGVTAVGPCRVCEGSHVLSAQPVEELDGRITMEVRCAATPALAALTYHVGASTGPFGGQCTRTVIGGPGALFRGASSLPDQGGNGVVALRGILGQVWAGPSSERALPLTFDRVPDSVVRQGDGSTLIFSAALVAWTDAVGFVSVPISHDDAAAPVAEVEGQPGWIVLRNGSVVSLDGVDLGQPPNQILLPVSSEVSFSPPYHALMVSTRTGGKALIVSAGQTIFSADLSGSALGALAPRVVPRSGSVIVALASPRSVDQLNGANEFTSAYALTTGGLSLLSASTPTSWSARDIALPPELVATEVWSENGRGRIGFTDGTVYALDTQVRLSEPLGVEVADYQTICGQTFALGGNGVSKLTPSLDGGALGTWSDVGLDPHLADDSFNAGRLHAFTELDGGTDLLWFSARGSTVKFPATCSH